MTVSGTGNNGGVRRLPKRHVAEDPPPEPQTPSPAPAVELYFEDLPEPEVSLERLPEMKQAQKADEGARPNEHSGYDPALFFRRNSPPLYQASSSADALLPAARSLFVETQTDASPLLPAKDDTKSDEPGALAAALTANLRHPKKAPFLPDVELVPVRSLEPEGTGKTSSEAAASHMSPTIPAPFGDPKPAARLSGVTRSRPQRPSRAMPVPRPNQAIAAADASSSKSSAPRTGDTIRPQMQWTEEVEDGAFASQPHDPTKFSSVDEVRPVRVNARAGAVARKRTSKAKSIVSMGVASLLLIAYAFEIGPLESAADNAAGHLTFGGAGSGAAQWVGSLLPWLLAIPALALFGLVVWLLAGIIGLRQPSRKRPKRRPQKATKSPLQRFKDTALRHGVDNRTAYRGWRLLETACGDSDALTLDANLTDDLKLLPRDQRSVHLQLLSELGRVSDPAMRLPATQTVLDLLLAVQDAPLAKNESDFKDVPLPGDPGQRRTRQRPTV